MNELKLTRYGEGFQVGCNHGLGKAALEVQIILRDNKYLCSLKRELYKLAKEREVLYHGNN